MPPSARNGEIASPTTKIFLDQGGVYLVRISLSGVWISDYANEECFTVTITDVHSLGQRSYRVLEGRRWNHVDEIRPDLINAECAKVRTIVGRFGA